jgi:tripartite-type tricarboxylate transporter receptor subunit TctC
MHATRLAHKMLCVALLAIAGNTWAQTQQKTIRWIVPFPPGGITDVLARLISPRLQPLLGQTIVVENRVGAGGMIAADLVAKGPHDGSMLLIAGQIIPTAPSLYRKLPFDPLRELAPVAQVGSAAQVLVVAPNHAAKSVKDLVQMARRSPGKLNYASTGNGSVLQLSAEMFKMETKTFIVQIPYRGSPEAVTAVMGGDVDFLFDNMVASLPQIQGGKLRALAVTSRERDPAIPGVPTMAEAGYPDFVIATWNGIWTTGGTPAAVVARLESELRKVMAMPEVVASINKTGVRVTNLGSRELARIIKDEATHWAAVLKYAGVQPQ